MGVQAAFTGLKGIIHFGEQLRTNHADLIDEQPTPLQNSLRNIHLLLRTVINCFSAIEHWDATCVVDCITAKLISWLAPKH